MAHGAEQRRHDQGRTLQRRLGQKGQVPPLGQRLHRSRVDESALDPGLCLSVGRFLCTEGRGCWRTGSLCEAELERVRGTLLGPASGRGCSFLRLAWNHLWPDPLGNRFLRSSHNVPSDLRALSRRGEACSHPACWGTCNGSSVPTVQDGYFSLALEWNLYQACRTALPSVAQERGASVSVTNVNP